MKRFSSLIRKEAQFRGTARRRAVQLPVTLIAVILTLIPVVAQTTTGTISGTVVDPGGALIPGAKVSVANEATSESRSSISSETGSFSFPSLLPATYTIRVE